MGQSANQRKSGFLKIISFGETPFFAPHFLFQIPFEVVRSKSSALKDASVLHYWPRGQQGGRFSEASVLWWSLRQASSLPSLSRVCPRQSDVKVALILKPRMIDAAAFRKVRTGWQDWKTLTRSTEISPHSLHKLHDFWQKKWLEFNQNRLCRPICVHVPEHESEFALHSVYCKEIDIKLGKGTTRREQMS